jgi:hypothetical protein
MLGFVRNWRRRRPAIELSEASATINGRSLLETLGDFEAALGAHSRKQVLTKPQNTLYFWDSAGLVAYGPLSSERISAFVAYLGKGPSGASPKSKFSGSLSINGVPISGASTLSSVQSSLPSLGRVDDNQYSQDQSAQFTLGNSGARVSFNFDPGGRSIAVSFGSAGNAVPRGKQ